MINSVWLNAFSLISKGLLPIYTIQYIGRMHNERAKQAIHNYKEVCRWEEDIKSEGWQKYINFKRKKLANNGYPEHLWDDTTVICFH